MKLYPIRGCTPVVNKRKTSRKVLASRKNGIVKVFHPVAIAAMNRNNLKSN